MRYPICLLFPFLLLSPDLLIPYLFLLSPFSLRIFLLFLENGTNPLLLFLFKFKISFILIPLFNWSIQVVGLLEIKKCLNILGVLGNLGRDLIIELIVLLLLDLRLLT